MFNTANTIPLDWKILLIPTLWVGKYCKYLLYGLENTENTYPMGWKILQIPTLWVGKYCKYLPYGLENTANTYLMGLKILLIWRATGFLYDLITVI